MARTRYPTHRSSVYASCSNDRRKHEEVHSRHALTAHLFARDTHRRLNEAKYSKTPGAMETIVLSDIPLGTFRAWRGIKPQNSNSGGWWWPFDQGNIDLDVAVISWEMTLVKVRKRGYAEDARVRILRKANTVQKLPHERQKALHQCHIEAGTHVLWNLRNRPEAVVTVLGVLKGTATNTLWFWSIVPT